MGQATRCGCLVTWFCYQLIAKPGNRTAAPSWPDPHDHLHQQNVPGIQQILLQMDYKICISDWPLTSASIIHNQSEWPPSEPITHSAHLTHDLWAHDWNLVSSHFVLNIDSDDPIRSQFCTCHDSSAVMTCAKLWPDVIIIFHVKSMCTVTRFKS